MIRVIRASDLVRRPWKNGGGATAELAVHPEGADLDKFDWRISMADVEADGPFSSFAGVDRTLVLLSGEGLTLDFGGTAVRLGVGSPPFAFPGDVPVVGRLSGGPVRDLNVMTRRSRFTHAVTAIEAGRHRPAPRTLLLAHVGPVDVAVPGETFGLGLLDALLFDEAQAIEIDAPAIVVLLAPAKDPPQQSVEGHSPSS